LALMAFCACSVVCLMGSMTVSWGGLEGDDRTTPTAPPAPAPTNNVRAAAALTRALL